MNDSFITALNTQKTTVDWINALTENMGNCYTPGYREHQVTFKTFLDGAVPGEIRTKDGQGKSTPGTSKDNIFLEGNGFFVTRNSDGKLQYTRLGEFNFDNEGVYKDKSGNAVQGYILNENGEMMNGTKPKDADIYSQTGKNGGPSDVAMTNIKLWMDPDNGKYLGKYDEFEFKEDGIIYGKANGGKLKTPLYKIAVSNFNNPGGLYEVKNGVFIETEESGKPVAGRGDIRSGLIELSNVDLKANITYYQQAKVMMEMSNSIVKTNKELLEKAISLLT